MPLSPAKANLCAFHTASECPFTRHQSVSRVCFPLLQSAQHARQHARSPVLCAAFRVPTAVLTAVGPVVLLGQVDVVESWPVGDVHPPPAALALRFVVYEPSHVLLSCSVKWGGKKRHQKGGWFR